MKVPTRIVESRSRFADHGFISHEGELGEYSIDKGEC